MTKAVFTTKPESAYDDLIEQRYHFPRRYLQQVEAAIGDWIVYYEPRRVDTTRTSTGGQQSYFATARVMSVEPDLTRPDHFYAFVSSYLEFDSPVPFREGEFYYESSLQREDGKTNKGAFGWSVRGISDREFDMILRAGYAAILFPQYEEGVHQDGLADEPAEFERPVVEQLVRRPFRNAAFETSVKTAYGNACGITGLKMINGGGRPEVQAAHIRPVKDSGPDSVRNGIALSGTVHWMFDRGLLSLDDDYTILMAKDRIPKPIHGLINKDGKLLPPARPELRPHPQFLEFHRQNVFTG